MRKCQRSCKCQCRTGQTSLEEKGKRGLFGPESTRSSQEGGGSWKLGRKDGLQRVCAPLPTLQSIGESRSPILMGPQGLQHGAFSGAVNVVISFWNRSHLRGKTACGCSLPRATPTPGMVQELGGEHTEVRADYDSRPASFGPKATECCL